MKAKVIDKLKRDGKCELSVKERTELLEIILNYHKLVNELKRERDLYEQSSLRNLKATIDIEKKYANTIQEQLNKADKRFEQAKDDYVHDKLHLSKLSEAQGYYQALVDLKRESESKDYEIL